ncbi:hypothetical protein KI387_035751, partial [Taxus chinensis]
MTADFLATMELKVRDLIWTQNLDYEGLPFRCRICFALGHLVAECNVVKKQIKGRVSWWKDFNLENLTVAAEMDNDSEELGSYIGNQGKEKDMIVEEIKVTNLGTTDSLSTLPVNDAEKGVAPLLPSISLVSPSQNIASLEISLPINPYENVDHTWGEGWRTVNNKKRGKFGQLPLKMSLRSHKGTP